MILGRYRTSDLNSYIPFIIGVTAAAFVLLASPVAICAAAVIVGLGLLTWWTLTRPQRWLIVFFAAAILLPPFPINLGDSGPHPALLFASVGVVAGILSSPHWRQLKEPLPFVFALFIAVLLESVAFAAFYSGARLAWASLARVLLFAIGPYVFVYTLSIPSSIKEDNFRPVRLLFRMAILAAVFACIDFYFQLPAPAGYEPQFVWLDDLVMRRAQGLFYEASTLGNFCVFFLVMILAALQTRREDRPFRRWELGAGGIVFALALLFSYSRGSLLNLLCAGVAMVLVRRAKLRWIMVPVLCIASAAASIYVLSPSFAERYWSRLQASFLDFNSAPGDVLSGRLSNWAALTQFAQENPWQVVLGLGYKTLPYSEHVGQAIIADNTYLDLLIETGIIGLSVFVALNVCILRATFRAARSVNPRGRFFGTWIFCFWVGELVQMFSGDLVTYWRVLPIYFWVLAIAIRESNVIYTAGTEGLGLHTQ